MSKLKRAPGPWIVHTSSNGRVAIYEQALSEAYQNANMSDPAPICIMKSDAREGHLQYANADLIAGAPDLLEACQAFLSYESHDDLDLAWKMAQKAVMKALGLL